MILNKCRYKHTPNPSHFRMAHQLRDSTTLSPCLYIFYRKEFIVTEIRLKVEFLADKSRSLFYSGDMGDGKNFWSFHRNNVCDLLILLEPFWDNLLVLPELHPRELHYISVFVLWSLFMLYIWYYGNTSSFGLAIANVIGMGFLSPIFTPSFVGLWKSRNNPRKLRQLLRVLLLSLTILDSGGCVSF